MHVCDECICKYMYNYIKEKNAKIKKFLFVINDLRKWYNIIIKLLYIYTYNIHKYKFSFIILKF